MFGEQEDKWPLSHYEPHVTEEANEGINHGRVIYCPSYLHSTPVLVLIMK